MEPTKKTLLDKLDVSAIGFAVGIVVPLLTFAAMYFLKFSHISWSDYLSVFTSSETSQVLLKAGVIANLPIFLVFNIFKRFLFCRGIFYASLIYIMLLFYLKFLV